jgi:hypothetical protein
MDVDGVSSKNKIYTVTYRRVGKHRLSTSGICEISNKLKIPPRSVIYFLRTTNPKARSLFESLIRGSRREKKKLVLSAILEKYLLKFYLQEQLSLYMS